MGFPKLYIGAIFGLSLLSGCTASGSLPLFAAASQEADTCPTPETCATQLKKMINEPKREWIGQQQSPEAYANGTRLFAYRALRKRLTCGELSSALEEFNLSAPSLQSAQYDRVRALLADVNRELRSEYGKRCTAHAGKK